MPRVSVMIITYNHEKFIAQALDSVLMQDVNFDYEILIGEDCSSDGTREFAMAYQKKHPDKIRLLLRDKNVGMMQNWVQTFSACTGDYIAVLEGDDYWTSPFKLQKQVDFLDENPDFSICSHNVVVKHEEGCVPNSEWLGQEHAEVITLVDLLRYGSGGATCSLLFRNRVFGDFPAWYWQLPGGDWTLQILCASHGKMRYFREPMGVYRTGHASNALSTAIRQSEKRGENPIGVAYKNTLKIIDTLDAHFQHRYTSLLENQRIYCYYNLALEYHNNGSTAIFRTYAWQVLKAVGKGHPFITFDQIFSLLHILFPKPFHWLESVVTSLRQRIK